MPIIQTTTQTLPRFTELSCLLFPDDGYDELYGIYSKSFQTDKEFGFLYQKNGGYVAMMHLSIRTDYVNGTDTSPVVYVEAIYILPEHRKLGIGRELITFAETFAKQKNITQLASDCLLDNRDSELFHKSCGFREEERVICFVKDVN
jgi:aminoglycoside 6'-N-acetyltransferase I